MNRRGAKAPWEVTDPGRLLRELNNTKLPADVGVRVRSCAARESKDKVHGTEKMADQINMLASGLLKIMCRTLPPLQLVAVGKLSDAVAGFWRVTFSVQEGKRYEREMKEALALIELAFPLVTVATAVFHYAVHIASHWRYFGPPRLMQCFVFESMIGSMVTSLHSRGRYVVGLLAFNGIQFIFTHHDATSHHHHRHSLEEL